jgi:S1-C subfamily serine protease
MASPAELRLVSDDDAPRGPDSARHGADVDALDAYSRVVTSVAERLRHSVVSLAIERGRARGGGSGVLVTPDGYGLTSAHVVEGVDGGRAFLADGRGFFYARVTASANLCPNGPLRAPRRERAGPGSGPGWT